MEHITKLKMADPVHYVKCMIFGLLLGVCGCGRAVADVSAQTDRMAWIEGTQGWLDNGVVKLGIDTTYGGAIVYLSASESSVNLVNLYDHGRQIQQSYYAGDVLDRTQQGQSEHWTPWPWNPVQAGNWRGDCGVVAAFAAINDGTTLYSETQPRLWDMDGELAQATMRQWTAFEPGMDNVIRVENQIVIWRDPNDIWGGPVTRHQECPAVYLIRDLDKVVFYDGDKPWQDKPLTVLTDHPGDQPPWDIYRPTEHWAACVYPHDDFGVGIYSTYDSEFWYVGAVGSGSGDAGSASTMHLAAIDNKALDRDSVWRYTYWIILGDIDTIRSQVYELHHSPAHDKRSERLNSVFSEGSF